MVFVIRIILALLLSVASLATAILHLRAYALGLGNRAITFRIVTMIMIMVIALITPQPISFPYQGAIILGLVLSLIGDIFVSVRGTPRVVGLAHYLIVWFLFFMAFAGQTSWTVPTPWIVPFFLVGWLMYRQLAPYLGALRLLTVIYMVGLVLVTWQTLEMVVQIGAPWTWCALVGVLFLVLSQCFVGLNYFHPSMKPGRTWALSTYYVAQWLIACSVWGNQIGVLR